MKSNERFGLRAGKDFRDAEVITSTRASNPASSWCYCVIQVNEDDFRFLACFFFWGLYFVTIDRGAKYRISGASAGLLQRDAIVGHA